MIGGCGDIRLQSGTMIEPGEAVPEGRSQMRIVNLEAFLQHPEENLQVLDDVHKEVTLRPLIIQDETRNSRKTAYSCDR